jgi:HK97 family phage prohead protease
VTLRPRVRRTVSPVMAKPTVLRKAIEQPAPMQVDFAKREIAGYGAVFGNVDNHGDIIERGAFKKTLADRLSRNLLKLFLCHEYPVGVLTQAAEDTKGLIVVGKVEESEDGDKALRWADNGVTSHMSIGYDVISAKPVEVEGSRQKAMLLQEVRLWEVSTVIWPANEEATVLGVKAAGGKTELAILRKGLYSLSEVLRCLDWVRSLISDPYAALTPEDADLVRTVLAMMETAEVDLYALVGEPDGSTGKSSRPPITTPLVVAPVSKSLSNDDAAALVGLHSVLAQRVGYLEIANRR